MRVRRSKSTCKSLPEPQLSCSKEITTTRVGKNKAWWACGPALATFEAEIKEELDSSLRNVGLGDADIYYQLYMIGRTRETADPIVMMCCLDRSVRMHAESSVRKSDVLSRFPEFRLGASALPLEQPLPSRELAGDGNSFNDKFNHVMPPEKRFIDNSTASASQDTTQHVHHSSTDTSFPNFIGRRIYTLDGDTNTPRYATGGVILWIKGRPYQMTVDHIDGLTPIDAPQTPPQIPIDYDECHFDGQSDSDDEYGDDANQDDTTHALLEASASPSVSEAPWVDNSPMTTDSPEKSYMESWAGALSPGASLHDVAPLTAHITPQQSTERKDERPSQVSSLAYRSRDGGKSHLDYALVPLDIEAGGQPLNQVYLSPQGLFEVKAPVPVGRDEIDVVVITASGGFTTGTLAPSATFLRKATDHSSSFQKLNVLQLDGVIVEGDCGSIVIRASDGHLLGHVVRGCSGTHTAYMTSAMEVFEDLQSRVGEDIQLVCSTTVLDRICAEGLQTDTTGTSPSVKETVPWSPTHSATPVEITDTAESKSRIDRSDNSNSQSGSANSCFDATWISQPRQGERLFDQPSISWDPYYPIPFALHPHEYNTAFTTPSFGCFVDQSGEYPMISQRMTEGSGWHQQPSAFNGPASYLQASSASSLHAHGILKSYEAVPTDRTDSDIRPDVWSEDLFTSSSPDMVSASPQSLPSVWTPVFGQPTPDPQIMLSNSDALSQGKTYDRLMGDPWADSNPLADLNEGKGYGQSPGSHETFSEVRASTVMHRPVRPFKCPVQSCEYHVKGFRKTYDRDRHTLTHYKSIMICGFCPGAGSTTEKSFNRADVFKRHLTRIHGVIQSPPNSHKSRHARSLGSIVLGSNVVRNSSPGTITQKLAWHSPGATGKCSICSLCFSNAQDFYEHLDHCILGVVALENGDERSVPPETDPPTSSGHDQELCGGEGASGKLQQVDVSTEGCWETRKTALPPDVADSDAPRHPKFSGIRSMDETGHMSPERHKRQKLHLGDFATSQW